MYQVRRVSLGKTAQLDELARECGRLYSQTLTAFWRTVRKGHLAQTQAPDAMAQQHEASCTYCIEHKQTSKLINTLHQDGVQTLVIGDVRDIRQSLDVGSKNNQKLHQWSHGSTRFNLTYKAERKGMRVVLQEESYTSKTCPACGHRRKSAVQGRNFACRKCGFRFHRDGVGAMNIRYKYREEFGVPHVVGVMAPPTGMRYMPHARVARWEKEYQREAARL